MEAEVAEYRRNKDFIIAQSKAAQVKKDIYEAKARMTSKRSPDDLMARHQREGRVRELAVHDVDVGPTHATDQHPDANLTHRGLRVRRVPRAQRLPEPLEHHRTHRAERNRVVGRCSRLRRRRAAA